MLHSRRALVQGFAGIVLVLLSTVAQRLVGQWPPVQPQAQCQVDCGGGGGDPFYAVAVTPDGGSLNATAFASGSYSFYVQNTGTIDDTYTLTCNGPGIGASCSVSPSSVFLPYGNAAVVTANYVAGAAGTGTLSLDASGNAEDGGYVSATITGRGYPVLTDTALNSTYRDVSKCVAGCFDAIYAHGTPAYFSMGTARSLTLVYNSATHRPTPTVTIDVADNAQTTPAPIAYSIQLWYNGHWITLLNGANIAYFSHAPSGATRLVAAFDALSEGMTTGRYQLQVAVKSHYAVGSALESTIFTNVLINDQSKSIFGAGVSLGEYQRLRAGGGPNPAVITEGDGSISFFDYWNGRYAKPPGGPASRLEYKPANPSSSRYVRTYMDGSSITFNTAGLMTAAVDRLGNATLYSYYPSPWDTLLAVVTDPMGKQYRLCYGAGSCGVAHARLDHIEGLPFTSAARSTFALYDGSGRLIRVTDPDNLSDSLAYGANGLLATIWNRARKATDLTYDNLYHVKTIKAPSVTLYNNAVGRPTISYSPLDTKWWFPDSSGISLATRKPGRNTTDTTMVSLVTDPLGSTTRVAQDRFGSPTRITDPYGSVVRITRDGHSRPTRIDDPTGQYTTYAYNQFDQVSGSSDASTGQVVNLFYKDTLTNDVSYITGNVVRQDFLYSTGGADGPVGALTKVYIGPNSANWPNISGSRLVAAHKVDNLGRDTAVFDSLGHGTHVTYEGTWGNVWKVKDPTGVETRLTYDNTGRVDSTLTPLGARTKVSYGLMNQVLTQTWSGVPGYKVTSSYDSMLAVIKVETPRTNGTSTPVSYYFKYNEVGALVRRNDAADTSKAEVFKYDSAGNLRVVVTRRRDTLALAYDRAGRLLSRIGKDSLGVVNIADYFRYDTLKGRWWSDSNAVAVNRDSIDHRGRLVQWTQTLNGRTYTGVPTYDGFDRVIRRSLRLTSPVVDSSVMTYAYDGAGLRTSTCAFNGTRCVSVSFKGDMARDTVIYNPGTGNVWKVIASNDANHRITGLNYSTVLDPMDITFFYDSLGRIRNRTSPRSGFTRRVFSYDSLGALVNACDSTGSQCQNVVNGGTSGNAWAYDSAGNRIAEAGVANITYGLGNRVQSYGGTTYTYHADGSTKSSTLVNGGGTIVKTYGWDAAGRLREIRSGSGTLIDGMYYDARGRRVAKKIGATFEYYVYEGNQAILDVDAAGTILREYAWSSGNIDQLLAVRTTTPIDTFAAIVDPRVETVRGLARFRSGALIKRYGESPWGDFAADTGMALRFRFAGREYDTESGLYYMRARYYDPSLGRWISEDPIGITGGANLYGYVGNDPVNGNDPFGLAEKCIVPGTVNMVGEVDPETGQCVVILGEIGGTASSPPIGCGASCGGGFGLDRLPTPRSGYWGAEQPGKVGGSASTGSPGGGGPDGDGGSNNACSFRGITEATVDGMWDGVVVGGVVGAAAGTVVGAGVGGVVGGAAGATVGFMAGPGGSFVLGAVGAVGVGGWGAATGAVYGATLGGAWGAVSGALIGFGARALQCAFNVPTGP